MFTQIITSQENKEVISKLTRKLSLGTENIIARIAYTYSLSTDIKLDLKNIKDSKGKEYSKSVLFGENYDIYIGLTCVHYNIQNDHKDISKYIKMHIDHGLSMINVGLNDSTNIFEFLIHRIDNNLYT